MTQTTYLLDNLLYLKLVKTTKNFKLKHSVTQIVFQFFNQIPIDSSNQKSPNLLFQ